MNKDEILAKSRAENKNKDVYEQEILKQASSSAVVVIDNPCINLFCGADICQRRCELGNTGACFQHKYDDFPGEIYKTSP